MGMLLLCSLLLDFNFVFLIVVGDRDIEDGGNEIDELDLTKRSIALASCYSSCWKIWLSSFKHLLFLNIRNLCMFLIFWNGHKYWFLHMIFWELIVTNTLDD